MSAKPAIFLDRDGTLNVDKGYVSQIDDFEFIEGAITACKTLKEMGYLLVIVTNQSGIARGLFTEAQFQKLTEWMDWSLADRGVELDGIYYCPHYLAGVVGEYQVECDCRKPLPGMIISAQQHLNIDLKRSYLVGDKESDLLAGKAGGVGQVVLVRTGQTISEETANQADIVLDSLADLPAFIKRQQAI